MWDLMKTGERITVMARIFNLREGFTKADDWLPERFFSPKRDGVLSKTSLDAESLRNAIELCYEMICWDKRGIPTRAKLEELGIGWTYEHVSNMFQ